MLVLSRHIGESVVIDGNIKIRIISKRGGQVRIGIEAPASVLIYREEIYKKLRELKEAKKAKKSVDLTSRIEDDAQ